MKDFIFLNVASSIAYRPYKRDLLITIASTQRNFFRDYGLLKKNAECSRSPIEEAVIRLSDFTDEGQRFIMTAATDKWLMSCDRKNSPDAYADPAGLIKRLKKFRESVQKH